jgi:DNA-binding MarR family transcriptional regulator
MSSKPISTAPPRDITDLLSARLHALAAMSAAVTTPRVERKFGLSLLEWRALAHLGAAESLSLNELARRAGLDKSYASRTVGGLIERGLVASERSEVDARSVALRLTKKGEVLYQKAFADAVGRNERLLGRLSATQRGQLMEMLDLVSLSAREALDDERRLAAGEAVVDRTPSVRLKANGDAAQGPDLHEIRYLLARLNKAVGND